MDYYSKYQKYKQKYLELKEIAKGGEVNNLSIDQIIQRVEPKKKVGFCSSQEADKTFKNHCKSKSKEWQMYIPSKPAVGKHYKTKGKLDDMCSSLPMNMKGATQTVQNMEAICQCCKKYPRTDYSTAPTDLLRE
jgi:hypothetical protein